MLRKISVGGKLVLEEFEEWLTEAGYEADVIAVEKNPLENMTTVQDPVLVISNGRIAVDRLEFVDSKTYPERLAAAQLATGLRDAAVWGTATLGGTPIAICVMDFGFMGGSMGAVVGEKVTRAAEAALQERIPLIAVSRRHLHVRQLS